MFRKICLLAAAAALPAATFAQRDDTQHRCTNGDLVRRVQIVYESDAAVPCEVRYFKDTEAPGESEVLWNAANEPGYCEARTQELVSQLESWGWQCTGTSADAAAAPAPAPRARPDDTAVLDAGDAEGE